MHAVLHELAVLNRQAIWEVFGLYHRFIIPQYEYFAV